MTQGKLISNYDDTELQKALKEARKSLEENNKEFAEYMKNIKAYFDESNKDYKELVQNLQENNQQSNEFMDKLRKTFTGPTEQDKYNSYTKYYQKRKEIAGDDELSEAQKYAAFGFIGEDEAAEVSGDGLFEKATDKMADEFSDGLQEMILGYKSFSETMKSIGASLSEYLLKQVTDTVMQMLFQQQMANATMKASSGLFKFGGGMIGTIGNFLGSFIGKHHSGGVIPSGSGYSLPGTEEQLALLKGGERVLSPSENVDYESNQGGSSPVVFNNYNIKAWDSKDVKKYLLENKQLLNSITYEGIKNNNNQLRSMVRNA